MGVGGSIRLRRGRKSYIQVMMRSDLYIHSRLNWIWTSGQERKGYCEC